MSSYQVPRVPAFAKDLHPDILQMHSSEYRNLQQLKPGGVLLVGAGNSGAEIAIEVAREHPTWVAGRDTGHVPFRVDGLAGQARPLATGLPVRVPPPVDGRDADRAELAPQGLHAGRTAHSRQAETTCRGGRSARAEGDSSAEWIAGARGWTSASTWRT